MVAKMWARELAASILRGVFAGFLQFYDPQFESRYLFKKNSQSLARVMRAYFH